MSKRFAAVDVGSNTVKVAVADQTSTDDFQKVFYEDFPSGLAKSMSSQKVIDPSRLEDCFRAVQAIIKIIEEKEVDRYQFVATHALREATNQAEIVGLTKSNTGVTIRVITGDEEARITLTAILMDFPSENN